MSNFKLKTISEIQKDYMFGKLKIKTMKQRRNDRRRQRKKAKLTKLQELCK